MASGTVPTVKMSLKTAVSVGDLFYSVCLFRCNMLALEVKVKNVQPLNLILFLLLILNLDLYYFFELR